MFVFVRHGQAEHNVAVQFEGEAAYRNPRYKDAALTFQGRQQSLATGQYLKHQIGTFSVCYTSPLSRCMDTALFLQDALGRLPTYANDALIECLGGGELCNMRMPKSKISNYWINVDALPEESPDPNQPRESDKSVRERLIPFLQNLLAEHEGNVLIVSHHDVLRALTGKSLRNAEVLVLSREELLHFLEV